MVSEPMPPPPEPAHDPLGPAHDSPAVVALVAAGGVVGALLRYGVSEVVPVADGGFPWATLATNTSGCLVLGMLLGGLLTRRPGAHLLRAFLGTGVLGAYTTYSTFAVETDLLARDGRTVTAMAYAVVSVATGLGAAWAGGRMGRWGRPEPSRRPSAAVAGEAP